MTFSFDEIKKIESVLDEAYKDCQFDTSESKNKIAFELDKAWNRGAFAMLNSALLLFWRKHREETEAGESA